MGESDGQSRDEATLLGLTSAACDGAGEEAGLSPLVSDGLVEHELDQRVTRRRGLDLKRRVVMCSVGNSGLESER